MKEVIKKLKGKLIVSCQAQGNSPFNSPEYLLLFARAAVLGGAGGIRSEGREKTKLIKENVNVPVIGLIKSLFRDGSVRITGSESHFCSLLELNCDIIALDGTFRKRERISGPDFIGLMKSKYECTIMADIATFGEGIACIEAGADCLSTTLSGYTPGTLHLNNGKPDYLLLKKLCRVSKIPVIAEGRISSPGEGARMISYGAWTVVVGTAITKPEVITSRYAESLKEAGKSKRSEKQWISKRIIR